MTPARGDADQARGTVASAKSRTCDKAVSIAFFSLRKQGRRGVDLLVRHPEPGRIEFDPVKLRSILHKSRIPLAADVIDDRRNLRLDLRRIAGPVRQGAELVFKAGRVVIEFLHCFTQTSVLSIRRVLPK